MVKRINFRKGTGTFLYGCMILMIMFVIILVCIEQFSRYNNAANTQLIADAISDGAATYVANNNSATYDDVVDFAENMATLISDLTDISIDNVTVDEDLLTNENLVSVTTTATYNKTSNVENIYSQTSNAEEDYSIIRSAATSFSTFANAVESPRLISEGTGLTYQEVYNNPWYSTENIMHGLANGRYGLDRLRGERGGNCTAYAWGRRCELEGERTQLLAGNACTWYSVELARGIYRCGQTVEVGAVCCWSYNTAGGHPGHVAIVEVINDDGSIITSESAWGSRGPTRLFYNGFYASEAALKASQYHFNGFIYLDKLGD